MTNYKNAIAGNLEIIFFLIEISVALGLVKVFVSYSLVKLILQMLQDKKKKKKKRVVIACFCLSTFHVL